MKNNQLFIYYPGLYCSRKNKFVFQIFLLIFLFFYLKIVLSIISNSYFNIPGTLYQSVYILGYYKYNIHYRLPPSFQDYKLHFINEWLPNETRIGRFLIYQPTAKAMDLNQIRLTETIYEFNFKTTYINVKNVLVSGYAVFGRGPDLISFFNQDKSPIRIPIIYKEHVETAIALMHFRAFPFSVFGNFMFPLYAIPVDIVKKSVFIIPSSPPLAFAKNFFNLFFPENRLLFLNEQEYAEVEDFHTVFDPAPGIQHFAHGVIFCAKHIKEVLNLTNIKSTNYGYLNRDKKYGRRINNFDDLTNAINIKFPNRNWINVPDDFQNFAVSFKIYSSLKVILTIVGSNVLPTILMNEGAGVFLVSSHRLDWECVACITSVNLWCYNYAVPGFIHFSRTSSVNVDVDLVVGLFGDLIYAVEHQKWPRKALKINKGFKRNFTENPK